MDIRAIIEAKILFIILTYKQEINSTDKSETCFEIIRRHNLRFEDFKEVNHQVIFKSIQNQISKGLEDISFTNLIEYRPKEFKVFAQQANEFAMIVNNTLNSTYASFSELDQLIYKLKEYNIRQFWLDKSQRILSMNFELVNIIEYGEAIIKEYEEHYNRIIQGVENQSVESFEESLKKRLEARAQGKSLGVPICLPNLQEFFNGWNAPDLIIIGARPGMGKTSFTLSMAWEASKTHHIVFLSLEMSAEQLTNKIASNITGIDEKDIRTGNLTVEQYYQVLEAYKHIKASKLNIIGVEFGNIERLQSELRRLKRLGRIDLLIVDYIQLMKSTEKFSSREQQISHFSRTLKLTCLEIMIPIIALSQLKRTLSERKPKLDDLRESGALEQDADIVAFLHRQAYYRDKEMYIPYEQEFETEFIVEKGRQVGVGSMKFLNDVKNSQLKLVT